MSSDADKILKTAEKKANSSGGWFSSTSSKWEDAGDLYAQAANAYKVEKNWRASGIAFEKSVSLHGDGVYPSANIT
jgi:alpha-soluble NSF attachment protein